VSGHDTPAAEAAPPAHPLAVELGAMLAGETGPRLLMLGIGNGRNVAPFVRSGVRVDAVEEDSARARDASLRFEGNARIRIARADYAGPYPYAGTYSGALSTSALLHGTPASLRAALAAVHLRLKRGAPLFATFGSTRDPRFGTGRRIDESTFAPDRGDEAGVPHAFFDEARLRALLVDFGDLDVGESSAAQTVGRWAHPSDSTEGIVHWFVRARA